MIAHSNIIFSYVQFDRNVDKIKSMLTK